MSFCCRLVQKNILPNKGSVSKVIAGETDKKTNGPLLIKLAYDSRCLPVIGVLPIIQDIEMPRMLIKEPAVITFETTRVEQVGEVFDQEWVEKTTASIYSLKRLYEEKNLDESIENIDFFKKYVKITADKIIQRLHEFLRTRIPLQRTDLFCGRHWVWDSLKSKMMKIVAMMIMSGHIVTYNDVLFRNDDETLLSSRQHFVHVDMIMTDGNIDGNYLVYDNKRHSIFRSGMAEVGMSRRWKEHVSGSMRSSHVNRASKFYKCYPNSGAEEDNMPTKDDRLGTFQQLEQLIGIGIRREQLTDVVGLFEWTRVECDELSLLQSAATRNELEDKKYRHLCYLFECAYALSIEPRRNISVNPGCEWQLKYYGN